MPANGLGAFPGAGYGIGLGRWGREALGAAGLGSLAGEAPRNGADPAERAVAEGQPQETLTHFQQCPVDDHA